MINKPPNSTIINVCIIPNDSINQSYVDISQSLESSETMFVLGGDKFAHMTVFMARFSDGDINKVVDAVERCLVNTAKFDCRQTGYLLTEGRYFESSYYKSSSLIALHESLIKDISPLRINPGNPYEEDYFTPYNNQQKQNAIKTGYDLAYNLFRPHITLTRYNIIPEQVPEISNVDLSFDTGRICVYKADDNGAIYELIKAFNI